MAPRWTKEWRGRRPRFAGMLDRLVGGRLAGAIAAVAVSLSLAGCSAAPCCPCPCPTFAVAAPAPTPWIAAARAHGYGNAAGWTYLAATYDADRDGRVTATEYTRDPKTFARLDKDANGLLTASDFSGPTMMSRYITQMVFARIAQREADAKAKTPAGGPPREDAVPDADSLSLALARADTNRDAALDEREVEAALAAAQAIPTKAVLDLPAGVRPFPHMAAVVGRAGTPTLSVGDVVAWRAGAEKEAEKEQAERPAKMRAAMAKAAVERAAAEKAAKEKGEKGAKTLKRPEAPKVGGAAPDFTLRSPDGATTVTLSALRGTPVALVFGSWTCPPFRHAASWIGRAFDENRDRVRFLFVYVREAHSIDGRAPMPSPDQPIVEDPRSLTERAAIAAACAVDIGLTGFVTLVDDVDDAVARAYMAPPARLYVVAADGTIAYRSTPGPFGLKPAEFEAAVRKAAGP